MEGVGDGLSRGGFFGYCDSDPLTVTGDSRFPVGLRYLSFSLLEGDWCSAEVITRVLGDFCVRFLHFNTKAMESFDSLSLAFNTFISRDYSLQTCCVWSLWLLAMVALATGERVLSPW